MSASFHYFIYCLMAVVAIAELVLTVFLFKEDVQQHLLRGMGYHNLLIFTMGASAWTVFFGFMYALMIRAWETHFLDNVCLSLWWLFFTSVLWTTSIVLFHNTRQGGICDDTPPLSSCRQSLTVESLGWTEIGLCLFTMLSTWVWISDETLLMEGGSWTNSWNTPGRESTREPSTLRSEA